MFDHLQDILRRIVGRPGNDVLPIWTVDEANSPYNMSNPIEWLVRTRARDRPRLCQLLAGLMRKVEPREWKRLDANLRSPWIEPQDVDNLARLPVEDAVEMLGVATFSASGYTRQAALLALRRLGHPRAVPYVLLRLGDWVEQVRKEAASTLRSLMDRGMVRELIEHHYLITHLRNVTRVDLSRLHAEICARLTAPSSRSALEFGLSSKQSTTRLFCFRLLKCTQRSTAFD